MEYFEKKLFLANVDLNDNIIGKVERWKAHKEGILHRSFTMVMMYKNKYVIQHRKHLSFDKTYDLSFSSHQIFVNEKIQTDIEAINGNLKREFNIKLPGLISNPKFLGKYYYKAKDPNSIFSEHEINYIYLAELKNIPNPNLDFAYDYLLMNKKQIVEASISFAPWVSQIIKLI